jgi:hypothetical protein
MLRHGIMDEKKQAALDKARTPKGREIAKALRPFARFQSADEYSRLVEGMCEEQVPPRDARRSRSDRRSSHRMTPASFLLF